MAKKKKVPKQIIDAFICHGLDLPPGVTDGNQTCDCPFCLKEQHFFVNAKDGRWDCKYCHENGNLYTFLERISKKHLEAMSQLDYQRLSDLRGLPGKAFRRYRVSWNGNEWLLPVVSEKGTIRDIRRWSGKGVWSTDYCNLQLYGLYELANSTREQRVWLCEGEWDAIAMRWLLDNSGHKFDVVVAVPGAGSFRDKWVPWFAGREVISCYDNDGPGDKGHEKAELMLQGTVKSLKFVNWPDTRPKGYDIRDLVCDALKDGTPMREAFATLEALIKPKRRRDSSPENGGPDSGESARAAETPIEFPEVVETFKKWLNVSQDMEDGLAISLAICSANELPHEPLWLYLIGPAGSGKTVILNSLNDNDRTAFYSNLTPASLVSGFNINPDPSILPKLNGKTGIFKDGTELLGLHPESRNQIYGTLRGAYDGSVYRPFGHGIVRDYKDLHFNLIIGVTQAIHGDNQANMGERFLKFEIREDAQRVKDKIQKAVENILEEINQEAELSTACRRFLLTTPDPKNLPNISKDYILRIVSLAQLISMLRAQVDRETHGDRDIRYRPVHETGTRVAKQMAKLARMLSFVFRLTEVDARVYKIIRRIAMDTGVGFNVDIVRVIAKAGNPGLSRDQIAEASHIAKTTLYRRIEDMEQLGILRRAKGTVRIRETGSMPSLFFLTDQVMEMWNSAWAPLPGEPVPAPPSKSPAAPIALKLGVPVQKPKAGPPKALKNAVKG